MSDYDLSGLNVLFVDDNKHMQALIREVLRALGIRSLHAANDGADAVRLLRTMPFDLVICDWNMKPMDGMEFVRSVRSGVAGIEATVPIIMLTGHTELHRVAEARDVGITEFLAKPVSASSIYHRIKQIIERPRAFVRSNEFSGPDRRRRSVDAYEGDDRRTETETDTTET